MRVLLIDDDTLLLKALCMTLERDMHEVHAYDSGKEAVAAFAASTAQGHAFDVVFTDLSMPGMDGREVAAAIKDLSPNTPVAMLSGSGQAMQEDGEAPPHVDLLIGKPPTAKALREALLQLTQRGAP